MWKKILASLFFLCLATAAKAELQINEILASNGVYESGEAYEWAEIKNTGNEARSLRGIRLAYERNGETFFYSFPDEATIAPGDYGVVFFIGYEPAPAPKAGCFYAPFEISRKGGTLFLLQDERILDRGEYEKQWGNISYGRVEDGAAWGFFEAPSRGEQNAPAAYESRAEAPIFSLPGGVYEASGSVSLSAASQAVIRFTVDGHEPTALSPVFSGPLPLDKGVTCIRARAFEAGKLPSETVTQTYFVGLSSSVPILSLVTDEKYLFDSKTGILVPGNGAVKNYEQDWEYPISVEYYDTAGVQQLNQIATFRVTGATSRKYGQKTLSLFARAAYGEGSFPFQPFENREGYTEYQSLTLRAAGTESFLTRFRDALLTSRAKGLGILYQESVPVIVYVNGEYWGHYNLRERVNKHMIAQFEGVTDDALIDTMTIIKGRGEVQMGSLNEWQELIDFCKKQDLNIPKNLQWLDERLDIDNYFTHAAIQMIVGNADVGNVRYYKIPGGKWKCALYDLDAGMQNLNKGPISYYNKTPRENSNLFYHEPFAALIRTPEMRERFFTLFGQILLHYLPHDLAAEVDKWTETLEPLMEEQIRRWPKCSPKSLSIWQYEVRSFRKICLQRPEKAVELVCQTYRLSNEEKQRYFSAFYEALDK